MNTTDNISIPEPCPIFLLLEEPYSVFLNALRILVLILYFAWIVIAVRIKDFRNKNMAYLYNLNSVALENAIYSIHLSFMPICFVPNYDLCFLQSFYPIYSGYIIGYSLSALVLHRLAIVHMVNLNKYFNWKFITITVSAVRLLPIIFTLFNFYGLNVVPKYAFEFQQCITVAPDKYLALYFNIVLGCIVPNAIVLIGYFMVLIKLKFVKQSSNSRKAVNPPRITIQLVIYIISYEIGVISYIIQQNHIHFVNTPLMLIQWTRILKWFQHYCPLGLLYFHPVLLKLYKKKYNDFLAKFK